MMTLRWVSGLLAVVGFLWLPQMAEAKAGKDCAALHDACLAAGFSGAGSTDKTTMISRDCMTPLLNGIAPPGNGKLALPSVAKDIIAGCQAVKAKAGKTQNAAPAAGQLAGAAPVAAKALPAGATAGPNIVLILADDFSLDLMSEKNNVLADAMPNLAQMMREGMTFSNYFVTDSLCCPSRTSIFTGLLPHNSGVITNTGSDGGYGSFMAHGNDAKTFAVALHNAAYATAMMGKYLNGYETTVGVPQGWSEWAVGANAYGNFNYSLNFNGTLISPKPHLTDEVSQLGQDFINASAANPFFLELATFSPHGPYTPPARYANAFPGLTYPKSPAYGARPDKDAPGWLQSITPIDPKTAAKFDDNYRLRVQSIKGIDDMIGAIRKTLQEQGLTQDTYVIFSSDNGYHMGEYSLRAGKMTPFDTDIHVPLIVVGPGVAAGKSVPDIVMNIDLYPTFLELAGLPASANDDGQSLAGLLHGKAGPGRTIAVVEHKQTAPSKDNPDTAEPKAGDPPTYVALRMKDALYVEYLDGSGEVGYYDMKTDPYQLHNIAPTLSADRLAALHDALNANHTCAGVKQCSAAQALTP